MGTKGAYILASHPEASAPKSNRRFSRLQHAVAAKFQKISQAWQSNSKFTIHPFRSLHSRHILPLSITDYLSRFSLEFVLLGIAVLAVFVNIFIVQNAPILTSSDQSILFSFVKNHPSLNNQLLSSANVTTLLASGDQLVTQALSQSGISLALASSQSDGDQPVHSDPTSIQDDVIIKPNPSDTENFARHGVTTYEVEPGDTISGIASNFGISPQTIMTENKIDEQSILRPGQELNILPTTGITYTVKAGDTLDALLDKYKISEDAFLDANNLESFEDLAAGSIVVIPQQSVSTPTPSTPSNFVKNDSGQVPLTEATAPANLIVGPVSFIWPTPVRNITQGFSSRHTGLDISDSKKEPIYAAADGFVEIAGYQTNGYGNTIVINHGNGYKTRYGHASELYVKAGDYVTQGQLIAKQGNTGRVQGITGIHLHFEIIKDGVRVNPLNYVQP